jgi:hypothetical protein
MKVAWRAGIAVAGVVLLGVLPWIWQEEPVVAYLLLLPLAVWAVWLMVEYLRWARRLGR